VLDVKAPVSIRECIRNDDFNEVQLGTNQRTQRQQFEPGQFSHILKPQIAPMPIKPTTTRKATPPSSSAKNTYLLAYNALSAALWAGVLYKTLTSVSAETSAAGSKGWFSSGETALGALQRGLGSGRVYDGLERYTRVTQTFAGLEVLHSVLGELS
jgi:hypothetical protein